MARRLLAPPFAFGDASARHWRKLSMLKILDWLELHPGATWQQRWDSSGAGAGGPGDWRDQVVADLRAAGRAGPWARGLHPRLGAGMAQLIGGDVIRPGLPWLLTTPAPARIADEMGRLRDPAGIAALRELRKQATVGNATFDPAVERIAVIMAAKGGLVADITPGDCIELLDCSRQAAGGTSSRRTSPFFYQLLHAAGAFPPAAPATVRMISAQFAGQLTAEQLIDRYDIACRPVRDLLVDYLRERQPGIDYNSLVKLATALVPCFWKDLEAHHPGISSLHLAPDVAAAWKKRLRTRTIRTPGGGEQAVARESADDDLMIIRGVLPRPRPVGPGRPRPLGTVGRALPHPRQRHPVQEAEVPDQGPHGRPDPRAAPRPARPRRRRRPRPHRRRRPAAAPPSPPGPASCSPPPGSELRRAGTQKPTPRTWAEDPATGSRRDLTREEDNAFWAWAAIEVLRHTGVRVEELTELSHHSLVQYRLPSAGELVPLLSIAPSKTDAERLLVIGPELADVLSAIITRVRGTERDRPARPRLRHRTSAPGTRPCPCCSSGVVGLENRPISADGIRHLLTGALAASGITGTDGKPLTFWPHDFRRVFTTDAILNGMPPHIAQLILGHDDINTTMGYKAVYPEEAIRGHRAFIAQRRAARPSEEYRTPTDAEWDEFLGHFERRRVALGDCGRAYSTPCIHEHSCIRCPLLRIDPAQRHRLEEIRDNLHARIAEAEREGWTGEAEGLKVSLAAATSKLAQADATAARRAEHVHLGIPAYRDIAATTLTAEGPRQPPRHRHRPRPRQRRPTAHRHPARNRKTTGERPMPLTISFSYDS